MKKQIVFTEKAPAAIGPYSQATKMGNIIFTSGQIALDPQTGEMVGNDVATQAKQAIENSESVHEASQASLENVAKTTDFLAYINDGCSFN